MREIKIAPIAAYPRYSVAPVEELLELAEASKEALGELCTLLLEVAGGLILCFGDDAAGSRSGLNLGQAG